jgi:hypothetical protein
MAEPRKKGELGSAPARRYLGSLYWDAREQTLVSYATTLLDVLAQLTPREEVFERWFLSDTTGATPLREPATPQLTQELQANRREWELHGVPYSAHQAAVTNARVGHKRCNFELACGITAPSTGIWFANQLHFEFFGPSPGFADPSAVEQLLMLLIENFCPAWGTIVTPHSPEPALEELYQGVPRVGWFTAFAPEYGIPPATDSATVLPAPGGWHLVRATDDWFHDRNPDHVDRVLRTRHALEHAGLLRGRV